MLMVLLLLLIVASMESVLRPIASNAEAIIESDSDGSCLVSSIIGYYLSFSVTKYVTVSSVTYAKSESMTEMSERIGPKYVLDEVHGVIWYV
jgi:hypothetical protein